jgi:hypothetical protein
LRKIVGITQIVFSAFLALSAAAGHAPVGASIAWGIAALAFLMAPILRQRRLPWTAGALATIVGIIVISLTMPIGRNEVWGPLLMGGPGLLLAVSAWLALEPARRRSVS